MAHMSKSLIYLIYFAALLHATVAVGVASTNTDPEFSPMYETSGNTLTRSGVGVLKYLGLIRIYNGALYLPPDVPKAHVLADIPKRLEVRYLRSFKGEDFGRATIAGIKKNVSDDEYILLESRIEDHNRMYPDIAPGDRVALTYLPSIGTQVEINGDVKGVVPGADFARALFSLWLGEHPFDRSFKRALLGNLR